MCARYDQKLSLAKTRGKERGGERKTEGGKVAQALMTQAAAKAPGPDKINFKILQMIWSWDKARITSMVYAHSSPTKEESMGKVLYW